MRESRQLSIQLAALKTGIIIEISAWPGTFSSFRIELVFFIQNA